jgi:hypothetical protein
MINITTDVFANKKVNSASKLFYGWLKANPDKCNASNQYYATHFDVSIVTINNWLFSLEKNGLIAIDYYKKTRTIKLIETI